MSSAPMIEQYQLERVIGSGSFATVWLARDTVLDRQVAIKILADNWSRDNDVRRRFLAEARVLLTVDSPRIVRAFHIGETDDGRPYLVMAHADRGTLGDRIDANRAAGKTFTPVEAVAIARATALALDDVHSSGHLHRDIKPTNVLIRSVSRTVPVAGLADDEALALADFGLARGINLSSLTLVAGSPGYVAPEQAAGLADLDARADIYSMGRVLLEMLTNDSGGRATTMARAATEQVDVGAALERAGVTLPQSLVDALTRVLADDREQRPATAAAFEAELAAAAEDPALNQLSPFATPPAAGGPTELPPPSATTDGATTDRASGAVARRRPTGAQLGVGLVAVAVVVTAIALIAGRGSGGDDTADSTTTPRASAPAVVATTESAASTTAGDPSAPATSVADGTSVTAAVTTSTVPSNTTVAAVVPATSTAGSGTAAPSPTSAPVPAPATSSPRPAGSTSVAPSAGQATATMVIPATINPDVRLPEGAAVTDDPSVTIGRSVRGTVAEVAERILSRNATGWTSTDAPIAADAESATLTLTHTDGTVATVTLADDSIENSAGTVALVAVTIVYQRPG